MLLRRRHASEHQKETEMAGLVRPSLPLTRSVLARARCSPLEEDSLLDVIRSALVNIRRKALGHLMKFTQGR